MGEFSWVSFGQSFWFAWFRACISHIPGSSCVSACVSQPWWILAKKPVGKLSITLLWTSKEPARWEDFLDLENENMVSYLLSEQGPASSPDCPAMDFGVSVWVESIQIAFLSAGGRDLPPASVQFSFCSHSSQMKSRRK